MTRMGAIMAAGVLDAGGRNATLGLRSRSGYFRRTAVLGLALFTQHWCAGPGWGFSYPSPGNTAWLVVAAEPAARRRGRRLCMQGRALGCRNSPSHPTHPPSRYWYPLSYMLSLSLQPTALIGVDATMQARPAARGASALAFYLHRSLLLLAPACPPSHPLRPPPPPRPLQAPKDFSVVSACRPSLFAYPPPVKVEDKKDRRDISVVAVCVWLVVGMGVGVGVHARVVVGRVDGWGVMRAALHWETPHTQQPRLAAHLALPPPTPAQVQAAHGCAVHHRACKGAGGSQEAGGGGQGGWCPGQQRRRRRGHGH